MSVRRRSSLPSPNRLFHPSHTSRLKSFEYQDYLTEVSKVGLRHVNSALRSVASSPRSQTPKLSSDVSLSESENSVLQYLKDFGKSKIYREANYPRTSTNNDEKRRSAVTSSGKEQFIGEEEDNRPEISESKPRYSVDHSIATGKKQRGSSEPKKRSIVRTLNVDERPQSDTQRAQRKSIEPMVMRSFEPPKMGRPSLINKNRIVKRSSEAKAKPLINSPKMDEIQHKNSYKAVKISSETNPKSPEELPNFSIDYPEEVKQRDKSESVPELTNLSYPHLTKCDQKMQMYQPKLQLTNVIESQQLSPQTFQKENKLYLPLFNACMKLSRLTLFHKLLSRSSGIENKTIRQLHTEPFLLIIFYDLILIFTFMQLCAVVYLANHYDMKLRLRSPLKGLARYAATRMPWLPGQYELRNQISGVWWSLCIIYIPTTIIFCKFYLDHNLKIPSEEKDQWMIRPYGFKTISEQITGNKSRQLLLAGCLFTGVILWLFYLIIFYYSFYFFHFPYWRNGIRDWLYELQRFYFWHFKELTLWVPKNSPKAYHLLDDGKDSFLIIDILQNIFECCGIENGTVDWASDHIERPKPSTYRKFMRISNSFQEAHYLIPNVSNRSLPFSCCKRNKYSFTTDSVPCNNINPINDDVFYNQGCLNPLMSFLTSRWMKDQMICLLIVLLTMIPQIIPMIASVSPGQLNEEFNTTLYSIEKAVIRQTAEIKNIGKAGVSQLRRLTVVYTLLQFNFKDDELYLEKELEAEEQCYQEQLKQKSKYGSSELDTLYKEVEAFEADPHKSQKSVIKNPDTKQLKQKEESVERRQQQHEKKTRQHQEIQEQPLKSDSKHTSKKVTTFRNISVSELHKVGIQIKPRVKVVKRINRINGRPPWKYTYKVRYTYPDNRI